MVIVGARVGGAIVGAAKGRRVVVLWHPPSHPRLAHEVSSMPDVGL